MKSSVRSTRHRSSWQQSLQGAVRSVDELLALVDLDPDQVPDCDPSNSFPLLVPREYIARMNKGDPIDPLLLQVLPLRRESDSAPGFVTDAVGDLAREPAPGMLHKYPSRVLLIASGMCAVHCRYCFRRHFPYEDKPKSLEQWQPALDTIASDPSIDEVILSGGDPLSLGNAKLQQLIAAIETIPHVRRLRLHTRFPLMIPNRIDAGFLSIMRQTRLATYFVWHINHANEIDLEVARVARDLRHAGVSLLNQAVLLRRINDSLEAQRNLSLRLLDVGIVPYYLHQLDRVSGAAHFEVPSEIGLRIVAAMRECLPGYAVPRFVQEKPGELSKTPLA